MRKLRNIELERLDIQGFKEAPKTPVTVVLDNIRSLNNIGSVFRTSDAFLIEKIYLCGFTATPPQDGIHKTALGATESVDWEYRSDAVDLIEDLKTAGKVTIAIEQAESSVALQEFPIDTEKHYVLVFGNEVKGVQQSVVNACEFCIEIPQLGTKHSLNVAVSAGVVLWEFFRQLAC
jgi:tRNA G18 (ribose-2'-O)-methylase SpoU